MLVAQILISTLDISPTRSLANSSVREDFTFDFFRPLLQADVEARASALESIMGLLEDSLKTEKQELIRVHLPTIVRFSTEVPFDDLTSAFQKLVKQIESVNTNSHIQISFLAWHLHS